MTDLQWLRLTDQWVEGDPVPDGLSAFEAFTWDSEYLCHARGELTLLEAWQEARGEILARWIEKRPGTRPSAWWRWDAPEPRRRVGGSGTPLAESLASVAHFDRGLPVGWLDRELASYYTGEMRHVVTGERVNPTARPQDFPYPPLDPTDPPRFESEAVYLARLELLTHHERLFAAGELDTSPELVQDMDVQPPPEGSRPPRAGRR